MEGLGTSLSEHAEVESLTKCFKCLEFGHVARNCKCVKINLNHCRASHPVENSENSESRFSLDQRSVQYFKEQQLGARKIEVGVDMEMWFSCKQASSEENERFVRAKIIAIHYYSCCCALPRFSFIISLTLESQLMPQPGHL